MKSLKEFYFDAFDRKNSKIPPEQFEFWGKKALDELNLLTFSRLSQELLEEQNIKQCVCEIAEALCEYEKKGNIKSENNDGYSVTYANEETIDKKVKKIAEKYLVNTGLLYRGF